MNGIWTLIELELDAFFGNDISRTDFPYSLFGCGIVLSHAALPVFLWC